MDVISLLVWDLKAEFLKVGSSITHSPFIYISVYHGTNLLNSHHNLDSVETIQSQVTCKVGFGGELYYQLNIYGSIWCFSKRVNLGVIRNLFTYVSTLRMNQLCSTHFVKAFQQI